MNDTRSRVPLNGKTVDLVQLAEEVGVQLSASATEVVVAEMDAAVSVAALSKAVKAHAPASSAEPVVEPLTDDEIVRLRALLDAS